MIQSGFQMIKTNARKVFFADISVFFAVKWPPKHNNHQAASSHCLWFKSYCSSRERSQCPRDTLNSLYGFSGLLKPLVWNFKWWGGSGLIASWPKKIPSGFTGCWDGEAGRKSFEEENPGVLEVRQRHESLDHSPTVKDSRSSQGHFYTEELPRWVARIWLCICIMAVKYATV